MSSQAIPFLPFQGKDPHKQGNPFCLNCGTPLSSKYNKGTKKWCSQFCGTEYRKKHNPDYIKYQLPSSTVGAMHEFCVAVNLMRKGYDLYKALSASSPCDLVACKKGKVYQIEVTTGTRNPKGTIGFSAHNNGRYNFDYLAVVLHSGKIFWYDKERKPCRGLK